LRHPFENQILAVRKRVRPEPFDWYSFDSFGNLTNIDAFVPGGIARIAQLAGDEPVADIGTGDGDLAFLLESLGCQVTAIDWPGTNANEMRGVTLMKRELGSSVEIREMDLDDRFRLDGERFGVVVALGLLYHLKNPFYLLERLAMHSRYILLSTRILPREKKAVAYLTADREFNDDTTNYWFLSKSGVERLLDRCGWEITHRHVTGARRDRLYCLAESRIARTRQTIRLLDGWNGIENDAWRWTKREFAFVVDNAGGATRFELRFHTNRSGGLTVQAEVNGVGLGARLYDGAGDHVYSAPVAAASRHSVRVQLSDAALIDGRELGVVVRLPLSSVLDEESGIRFP
jgi:2-polyprenyl-3-methyl-5-hydroxy-6-metoxy-1,4-benzoquinol methylase